MLRSHPLDLYEIRLKVARHLKLRDLASCVRVNRDWNNYYSRLVYDSVVLSAHGPSMESIKKNKHILRTLTIESNAYEKHFDQCNVISIVMASSTLTALNMKGDLLKDSSAQELAEELKINSSLATLNLNSDMYDGSGNSIGVNGAQALAEALKTNKTLATLNLRYNSIGDDGAQALANALKTNSTLTNMDLGGNSIGDNAAQRLSEALKTNSTLTALYLYSNSIGDNGAWALANALETNSPLAILNLRYNSIGDNGAQALADALYTNSTLVNKDW